VNAAFEHLGFYPADLLIPQGVDLEKWSVVACDQYTSEPEYWNRVEKMVGEAPSTLRLILPESKLESPQVAEEIAKINRTMEDYWNAGLFRTLSDSLVYVERTQRDGKLRRGLVGMVDLEDYDYTPGSSTLIRATEGTVLSRIPPRVKVREGALLELPHIMLLIDDRQHTVIEPLTENTSDMEQVYDFQLMEGGGHLSGWKLGEAQLPQVAQALRMLGDPAAFEARYQLKNQPVLLYATGDGNHSLATAKTVYEELKQAGSPLAAQARYALAEVVNLHDAALEFEPIHRVVFGVEPKKLLEDLKQSFPGAFEGEGEGHVLRCVTAQGEGTVTVPNPKAQLPVGTLQGWLDDYVAKTGCKVDYIHGEQVTRQLGSQPGNVGFLLPPMGKEELFRTVIADGVLPRKTFSMGEAWDKRFYLEARKIR
jgi:uncharacterized protein (DUF1015 family)